MVAINSFKLPNGLKIEVAPLDRNDYKELNQYLKREYLKNVSELTNGMNAVERQEFLLAALDNASTISFQYGKGNEMLVGSFEGMARLAYQLIEKPEFSFDGFCDILFPDGFLNSPGIQALDDITNLVYPDLQNIELIDNPQIKGEGESKTVGSHKKKKKAKNE